MMAPLGTLEYLYVGTADFDRDCAYYATVLGGERLICWENYMPLLRTAMYARGVELYCAVTVDDREAWVPTVRHIALEGRCFVLSACQVLRRADLPSDYPSGRFSSAPDVVIRGGSCIVGPL